MGSPFDLSFVFFGGKGGVGKTTCASAFSLLAADNHRKTLVVSTDAAHSLSDIFGVRIGHRETPVRSGLWGLEIDPDHESRVYIDHAKSRMKDLLAVEAFSKQLDLSVDSPGTQEAAMFDRITDLVTREPNPYDMIIFDTAPTGQTLRLLSLPEQFAEWMRILAQRRRKVSTLWKIFSGLSKPTGQEDPVLALLEERERRFVTTRERLTDPSKTGLYWVMLAERLSILETQKAVPVLGRHGMPIRGVIVNRLIPAHADGEFLEKRRKQERIHIREIENLLPAHTPLHLHLRDADVVLPDALGALAREMRPFLH